MMKKVGKILGVAFLCGTLLAGCGSVASGTTAAVADVPYEEAAYEEGAYDMDDSYSMKSAAVSNAAM